jgi:hypothetical protein
MSHRTLSPQTQRVLKSHGVVISYAPSRMPAVLSFVLTAALFLGAFLATFAHALADDRNTDPTGNATGNYYYDRYALPYVKRYAPPDTASGTYSDHDAGGEKTQAPTTSPSNP